MRDRQMTNPAINSARTYAEYVNAITNSDNNWNSAESYISMLTNSGSYSSCQPIQTVHSQPTTTLQQGPQQIPNPVDVYLSEPSINSAQTYLPGGAPKFP